MSHRRVAIVVSGAVQGVFFRSSAQDEADRLGLSGWVRNLRDGSVEAQIQGSPKAVDEMIQFCQQGPTGASVSDMEVRDLDVISDEAGFRVR